MSETLQLLYSANFKIKIIAERDFDLVITLKKPVIELYDLDIKLHFPHIKYFDKIIELVREINFQNELKDFRKAEQSNVFSFANNSNLQVIDRNLANLFNVSEYMNIPLGDVLTFKNILQNQKIKNIPIEDKYIPIIIEDNEKIGVDNLIKPLWSIKYKNITLLEIENINQSLIKNFLNKLGQNGISYNDITLEISLFTDEPYYLMFQYPYNDYDFIFDDIILDNNVKYYINIGFHKLILKPKKDLSQISQPYLKCSNKNINSDFYDLTYGNVITNLKIGYLYSSNKNYPEYLNELFQSKYIIVKDIVKLIKFFYSYTPKVILSNSKFEDFFEVDNENNKRITLTIKEYNLETKTETTLKENQEIQDKDIFETHSYSEITNNVQILTKYLDLSLGSQDYENSQPDVKPKIYEIRIPFKSDKTQIEDIFRNNLLVLYIQNRINFNKFTSIDELISLYDETIINIGFEVGEEEGNIKWLDKSNVVLFDEMNYEISSNEYTKVLGFKFNKSNYEKHKDEYYEFPFLQFFLIFRFPQYILLNDLTNLKNLVIRFYSYSSPYLVLNNLSLSVYDEDLIYIFNSDKNIYFKFNSNIKDFITEKNIITKQIEFVEYISQNFKIEFNNIFKDKLRNEIISIINTKYKFIKNVSDFIFIRNVKDGNNNIVKLYAKLLSENTTFKKNFIF